MIYRCCSRCGGCGFTGPETGYDGVCLQCGGLKVDPYEHTLKSKLLDIAKLRFKDDLNDAKTILDAIDVIEQLQAKLQKIRNLLDEDVVI